MHDFAHTSADGPSNNGVEGGGSRQVDMSAILDVRRDSRDVEVTQCRCDTALPSEEVEEHLPWRGIRPRRGLGEEDSQLPIDCTSGNGHAFAGRLSSLRPPPATALAKAGLGRPGLQAKDLRRASAVATPMLSVGIKMGCVSRIRRLSFA